MRDILVGCGLDEVITYSMIDVRDEAKLGPARKRHIVTVLNPLTAERGHLRVTLLPCAARDGAGKPALRRAGGHLRGRPGLPAAARRRAAC